MILNEDGTLHFSSLKQIAKSPAHYVQACNNEMEDKASFRIGRALHALVLLGVEPVVYSGIRRGKEWDAFCAENVTDETPKDDILNETENATIQAMAKSIRENAVAMDVLEKCTEREKPLNWIRDGIPCGGRVDAYSSDVLLEIKTTANASPRKFLYDAHKFSYHAQLAWYDIALGTEYKPCETKWRRHVIIAVESKAPFCSVVFELENLRKDQGHTLCEEWLDLLKECALTGEYPSYAKDQPVMWDGEIIINDEDEEDE